MSRPPLLPMLVVMLTAQGVVGAASAQDAGADCLTVEVARRVLAFPLTKEADMRFKRGDRARKVLANGQARLRRCATSEGSWYAILHARELLGCDPRSTLGLADRAQRLLPKSAPIATLRARLLGTATAAKEALALDPAYIPAQLALASALLDEGRAKEASGILRKIDKPEARWLKARVRLIRRDYRGAIAQFGREWPYILGGDSFLLEPNDGLDWPWSNDEVLALAEAELGKVEDGAGTLYSDHVGSLPELRAAVANRTKAAERLMTAMGRLVVEDSKYVPESSTQMAVALARLRFIAGQMDDAMALLTASPATRSQFCATLPELTWILSAGDSQPVPQIDKLKSLCSPENSDAKSTAEPPECQLGL